MFKKISVMFLCDIALALLIFTKVSIKNFLLKNLSDSTLPEQADSLLSSNNWVSIIAMIFVAIVICIAASSKTTSVSQVIVDIVLFGIPGIVLAIWWWILSIAGWGYFCSYQEMMAYIGALMLGTCIYKTVKYIFNNNNGSNG